MNTYWEQRAIDSAGRMDAGLALYTSEMVSSFEQSKKSLQTEINAFYGKYAVENKISLAEAQKQLDFAELKDFIGDLKEYENLAKNSIGTYDLTVSNLSKKARITRLQALEMQCDTILQKLYQKQKESIEEICTNLYAQQYYHKLFDIEQYTGFQSEFATIPTDKVAKVLSTPVNGTDISTSLWRQDMDIGFKIRQTLNEMFITGKPPQEFAIKLQKIIGVGDAEGNLTGKKYEAYRLLYNESSFVTEQATLQAYNDDEIEDYKILAVLDIKTSPICREQDNKQYKTIDAVTGVNYPPFHVNCRTTTIPFNPDVTLFDTTRVARDENENNVMVRDQSYKEWYDNKVNRLGQDKVDAQEKMYKNRHSDKKQYEEYKDIFKKDVPNSFAKFQDLKYNRSKEWERFNYEKQGRLNSLEFSEIPSLKGTLRDKVVRVWYKTHDENIPNLIDLSKSNKEQAVQAHGLRNMYRIQARDLMLDQEKRKELDIKHPNQTFEEMLQHKKLKYGLSTEDAYKDIIRSSQTTNKEYDKKAGLEG